MNIGETARLRITIINNRNYSSFVVAEVNKDHYFHLYENPEQSIRDHSVIRQQIIDKTQSANLQVTNFLKDLKILEVMDFLLISYFNQGKNEQIL